MAKKLNLSINELQNLIVDYENNISLRSLEKKYNHDRKTLSNILKEHNITIRNNSINSRKYFHNESFFETINTEHKAYWLGFLYADGFIESKRENSNQKIGITLKHSDINHLYKFKKDIEATNPIKIYKGSGFAKENMFAKILLTSSKTVNDLKDKGVAEHKTYLLNFPTDNIVPKDLIHHFIRGYFDGDGSLSYYNYNNQKKYCLGFTGTKDMLKGISSYFNKNNLKIVPHNNAFELHIGGNIQLYKILNIMYLDATIYLDRKKEIYDEFLNIAKARV